MARPSYAAALISRVPPWLRRAFGARFMGGLGDPLDAMASRTTESIQARFPDAGRPDALATLGTERRIPRGPTELDATYAARLAIWLDSHRTRGGPYAMLAQWFAFWADSPLSAATELVNQQGARWSMDATGAVTRDQITGRSFGTFWAQDWLFIHAPEIITDTILGADGRPLVDGAGHPILFAIDLASGILPPDMIAALRLVPSTWAPAHLRRCTIVLLWGNGMVYGYPTTRTFGDGGTYGQDHPISIVIDF